MWEEIADVWRRSETVWLLEGPVLLELSGARAVVG